jgi:hypothetical protein
MHNQIVWAIRSKWSHAQKTQWLVSNNEGPHWTHRFTPTLYTSLEDAALVFKAYGLKTNTFEIVRFDIQISSET